MGDIQQWISPFLFYSFGVIGVNLLSSICTKKGIENSMPESNMNSVR
jgi:hypothetical protein